MAASDVSCHRGRSNYFKETWSRLNKPVSDGLKMLPLDSTARGNPGFVNYRCKA